MILFGNLPEDIIKREREKSRKLRKTQWWLNKVNVGVCHYCGEKFPRDQITMDHVIPLIRGGKSSKNNIVAACKNCNNQKTTDIPAEKLLKDIKVIKPSS